MIPHEWYLIVQGTLRNYLSDVVTIKLVHAPMAVILLNDHLAGPENRWIYHISGTSQRRINILVSTHIFSEVRNPIKALLSALDHHNMLKHAKYTFKMVRHMPKFQLIQRSCPDHHFTSFSLTNMAKITLISILVLIFINLT